MTGDEANAQQRFDPLPGTAGAARRLVRELLLSAGRDDMLDAAELVVSELVTNALLHAATAVEVSAAIDGGGLSLEVADGSTSMPTERDHAALAGTGRGLALVHDLTEDWGVDRRYDGKVVWARIAAEPSIRSAAPPSPPATLPSRRRRQESESPSGLATTQGATSTIVLRNVPLLMHLAWHEQAETLLREYLLARLEDDELTALSEHASASSALALLHDQVPVPSLPGDVRTLDDVENLLTVVVEPAATLDEGRLRVPAAAIADFSTLNHVMDAALAMAEADRMLAAPIQPELRELRRWLCSQVLTQSAGADPVGWAPTPSMPAPGVGVRETQWDRSPIDRSSKALVAADDTNRIIAVSPPALDLLGYPNAEHLIGLRLLALIPARFHQGHLAGFTLHLSQGRSPLIGATALLPFVRADGSETDLELHIDVLNVADGRRVFIGTLRAPE